MKKGKKSNSKEKKTTVSNEMNNKDSKKVTLEEFNGKLKVLLQTPPSKDGPKSKKNE